MGGEEEREWIEGKEGGREGEGRGVSIGGKGESSKGFDISACV